MITRHMRTHLRSDGTTLNELLIPPISQLSLNQPPTPEPELSNCSTSPISQSTSSRQSLNPSPLPPTTINIGNTVIPSVCSPHKVKKKSEKQIEDEEKQQKIDTTNSFSSILNPTNINPNLIISTLRKNLNGNYN